MPKAKPKLTPEQLTILQSLSQFRVPMEHIAQQLGWSKKTLERRAKDDKAVIDALSKGRAAAAAMLHKTAFEMAISKKQPAMTIFYLKTQFGWKETPQGLELLGPDGKAQALTGEKPFHEKMEELAKLVAILKMDDSNFDEKE